MKKILIASMMLIISLAAQGQSQKLAPTHYITHNVSTTHEQVGNRSLQKQFHRKRMILVIDKSTSIMDEENMVNVEALKTLLRLINEFGGELVMTTFGVTSKKDLESYRSISDGVEKPTSKLPGETPQEFRQRIIDWKQSRKPKTESDIEAFLNIPRVQDMLDYRKLEGGSDVAGGVDMAVRFLNESDPEMPYAENIAILVTDGEDNQGRYRVPSFINGQVYLVHRSEDIGILNDLVPASQVYHSFDSVVRTIVHNAKY